MAGGGGRCRRDLCRAKGQSISGTGGGLNSGAKRAATAADTMNTMRVKARANLPCLNRKRLGVRRSCPHIARMADGYIIEVTNPFVAADEPVKQIWYAHIHDRNRAIRAVRKAAGAPQEVSGDVVRSERHVILLERLGILEGEVRSV